MESQQSLIWRSLYGTQDPSNSTFTSVATFTTQSDLLFALPGDTIELQELLKQGTSTQTTVQSTMGFSLAGKKGLAGGPPPKQNNLMENYGVFNLQSRSWEVKKVEKGKTPPLRLFFATYFDYPRLFLHGGASLSPSDKKLKSQGDLYLFDCEHCTWKKTFVFDQPTGRDMHSMTKVGALFYIYGGQVSPNGQVLDELWQLDVSGADWKSKMMEIPGVVWSKVLSESATPMGLKGHAAVGHQDQKSMIVSGGQKADGSMNGEVFTYDTEQKQWSIMSVQGKNETERYLHSMILTGQYLIMQGGLNQQGQLIEGISIIDMNSQSYISLQHQGLDSFPNYQLSMCLSDQSLILLGGLKLSNQALDISQLRLFSANLTQQQQQLQQFDTTAYDLQIQQLSNELDYLSNQLQQTQEQLARKEEDFEQLNTQVELQASQEKELMALNHSLQQAKGQQQIQLMQERQQWATDKQNMQTKIDHLNKQVQELQQRQARDERERATTLNKYELVSGAFQSQQVTIMQYDRLMSAVFEALATGSKPNYQLIQQVREQATQVRSNHQASTSDFFTKYTTL
ncbi:hypothetical protein FGO68_gene1325 [Halteria grandinella]|uniref:Attractin/MKLN-like beta-propeller domain-containing protein n=1 Tax=Halteria grandinella TaxID=5974 RepID=A0A8J8NXD4_HALGN|nr:hypothetical protein FGO68_gene1325 [Halteria grandinella]